MLWPQRTQLAEATRGQDQNHSKVCAALLKNLHGCFDFAILCLPQPMESVIDELLEMLAA